MLVEAELIVPAGNTIFQIVTITINTKYCKCTESSKHFPAYNPLLIGQNVYPNKSYFTRETSCTSSILMLIIRLPSFDQNVP